MKIDIFCPICKAKGRKKLLLRVEDNTKGTAYAYCKYCHAEVEIKLEPLSLPKK